jgi:hypothetical protein
MIQLSVLDQSIAAAGSSQDQAVCNTLALAQHCEAWGYRPFWSIFFSKISDKFRIRAKLRTF